MSVYGIFENQPAHVLDHVLPKIPYSDLRSLALTSPTWHRIVKQHVHSTRFQKDSVLAQDFCDLGKLIATVSDIDAFDLIQRLAIKIWKENKSTSSVGELVCGFCSVSSEFASQRVEVMFNFLWNLIGSLEKLVCEVAEPTDWEDLDEEEIGRILDQENEQKKELRRQLSSLFFPESSSSTYGLFLIQLIRKLRIIVEDNTVAIADILHLLLNPLATIHGVEFIDFIDFGFDTMTSESSKSLERMARAFKSLQKSCSSEEETEFCKDIFHMFMEWDEKTKAALLAHEPSLLSWYIRDLPFLVIMGSGIAKVLVELALTQIRQKSPKIGEFRQEFAKIRESTLQKCNGKKHWAGFQKRISDLVAKLPGSQLFNSSKLSVLN